MPPLAARVDETVTNKRFLLHKQAETGPLDREKLYRATRDLFFVSGKFE